MSTAMRVLFGIGLLALGFYVGRAVGRMEPITEELRRMRRRRGIIIDGEKVAPEHSETDARPRQGVYSSFGYHI